MGVAFSVVIPVDDAPSRLETLLRSIANQAPPTGGFEVIVVTRGSPAGIADATRRVEPRFELRVLEEPNAGGRTSCRERGWRIARGDSVVFVDPDMVVDPNWLIAYQGALTAAEVVSGARWWKLAGETTSATEAAARGACVGPCGGPVFAALEEALPELLMRAPPQGVAVALAAQASNLAIRRSALERTTGFDTLMDRFSDFELGIRLWRTGARFAYCREARAVRLRAHENADPWLDDDEAQALFWLHPYVDLLRTYAWGKKASERGRSLVSILDEPVDIDDLRRSLDKAAPGLATCTEADTIAHLARTYVVAEDQIAPLLARGLDSGLFHEVRDGVRYFQLALVEDWIRNTTPMLQRDYENQQSLTLFGEPPDLRPTTLRVRAEIRVSMDPEALAAARITGLNIALPVESSGQRGIELVGASSSALLDAVRQSSGILRRFPCPQSGALVLEFTYEVATPLTDFSDGDDPASHLRILLPPPYQERARHLLRSLRLSSDRVETGRAILEWIEDHLLISGAPPRRMYYRLLDFGVGACVHQARLFVQLCRLAGIPARERCGALLVPRGGEERAEVTKKIHGRGTSPFFHSWAEFFVDGRGWIPAEVRGWGRRALAPLTMPDAVLREEVERVLYRRYPFGVIHPYRLTSTAEATRLPPMEVAPGAAPAAVSRALDSLTYDVTCTFSRNPHVGVA